jgi:uncharacterized protein YprB with RNaseH-like and TPR domain
MLPKHIRRKLSQIGREARAAESAEPPAPDSPMPDDPAQKSVFSELSRSRLRQRAEGARPEPEKSRSLGPAQPLEVVCPGEKVETEFGAIWVAKRPAASFPGGAGVTAGFLDAIRRPGLREMHRDFRWLAEASPEQVLFLDTETAGLTSVPLFLCGFMYLAPGGFVIEQLLARDYAEEPALLARTLRILADHELLITYNGKTFDIPFIKDRCTYHLIQQAIEGRHVDLLQHVRRRYKGRLPDCKLQTLERHLCGRPPRMEDIAGEEIPQAYHDFVATSNASLLRPIIEHNALDLITLAEIAARMAEPDS